jgi:hypothetical protein
MSNIYIAQGRNNFGLLNLLITNCPFRNTSGHQQITIHGPHSKDISAFNFQCERPRISLFIQFSFGPDPKWATKHSLGYLHYNENAQPYFIYVSSYEETIVSIKWVIFITYKNDMVRLDVIKPNDSRSIYCENYTYIENNTLKAKTPLFSSFAGLNEEQINQLMPLLIA